MPNNLLRVLPQYLVPQHLLSRLVGYFTHCQKPWFKNWLIDNFIKLYGVDMSMAVQTDPHQYATFNAFFTRALKTDARPIASDPSAIVSPVDGCISQFGKITEGRLIQAKGFDYGTQQLLGGSTEHGQLFLNGNFMTLYLSPKDYHRVHLPLDATLREMIYVPGYLFSVNPLTAETVPNLFARNERVVMLFDTKVGPMAVIMVGAMICASIHITWEGTITPPQSNTIKKWNYLKDPKHFSKGAELGHFELGSTVILLFNADKMQWQNTLNINQAVQFGQPIGHTKA